ncbi:hypothetical protein D3C77_240780 [compost metagenome]
MQHILDQQVWLDLRHLVQGRAQQITGQDHLGADPDTVFMQQRGFIGEPLAAVFYAGLVAVFIAAEQAEGVELLDNRADMQGGTGGVGQGGGALQRRGVAHVVADHQEQALVLAHGAPPVALHCQPPS